MFKARHCSRQWKNYSAQCRVSTLMSLTYYWGRQQANSCMIMVHVTDTYNRIKRIESVSGSGLSTRLSMQKIWTISMNNCRNTNKSLQNSMVEGKTIYSLHMLYS